MSWENQIRKIYSAEEEIKKALNIISKLRKQYNIKPEHTEGLDEILIDLLRNIERINWG